jgi:alpha-tubulin suppressor-like RCC1 family protein
MKKIILSLLIISFNCQIKAQCWEKVSAHHNHSLAIKNDGTLWAWGSNQSFQLGGGSQTFINYPIQIGLDNDWESISAGDVMSLAIKSNGTLWQWGSISPTIYQIPTQVGTDTDWSIVVAGFSRCFAIKNNGTLWGWGFNNQGSLGDGTLVINISSPLQIGTESNWMSIGVGYTFTIGTKSNGTMWAWGLNSDYGELGIAAGLNVNYLSPTQIGTDTNWQQVKCGSNHTIALKSDGTLWSWGRNNTGQLGDGTYSTRDIPVQIGLDNNWLSIDSGFFYNFAMKNNQTLWTWGSNYSGQFGNGTQLVDQLTPLQITSISTINKFKTGGYHTMFITTDSNLLMSGANNSSQLGIGQSGGYATNPIQISCSPLNLVWINYN